MNPAAIPAEIVEAVDLNLADLCFEKEIDGAMQCTCATDEQIRLILAAAWPLIAARALEEAAVEALILGTVSGTRVEVGTRAASWLGKRAACLRTPDAGVGGGS